MKEGSNILSVFIWDVPSCPLYFYTPAPPHLPLIMLGTWKRRLPMKDREEEGGIQIDIYVLVSTNFDFCRINIHSLMGPSENH